jgi:hypothetical protein
MNVFIVFHGLAHGGETVVGVYTSLDEAKLALDVVKTNYSNVVGKSKNNWTLESTFSNVVESWEYACWYLEIREFEIGRFYHSGPKKD